jgi:hypothetical protein
MKQCQVHRPPSRTDKRGAIQPAGSFFHSKNNATFINFKERHGFQKMTQQNPREAHMGMVMIKCPQTGRAIPTGIKTDRESFRRKPVFFARTRCPNCHIDHTWFAREAWVSEFGARALLEQA